MTESERKVLQLRAAAQGETVAAMVRRLLNLDSLAYRKKRPHWPGELPRGEKPRVRNRRKAKKPPRTPDEWKVWPFIERAGDKERQRRAWGGSLPQLPEL